MKLNTFLLVMLAGILAACASGVQTSTPPVTRPPKEEITPTEEPGISTVPATLRLGINAADLGALDPHFAAGTNDRIVVDMVFNGLLRYQPGNAPALEPDLAESVPEPEVETGKQIWTFRLKKGVMCHAGPMTEAYELTADDVVYSLQKSANPQRSTYAGEYTGMSAEKVDDYTIKVIMETPLSPHLFLPKIADYAGGFIVCQKAVEAMGDEVFKIHPVGTGPFMFKSYTPGKQVQLIAHEQYFRGQPKLAGVEVMYMPNISSRESSLMAGKIDVINGLSKNEWIKKMQRKEGIVIDLFGVGEMITVHFNTAVEPLDDVRVRKAIAYALDRDEFLGLFGQGVATKVYSIVPSEFLPGGLTQEEVESLGLDYAVDLEKARQLLTEAGYPDGFRLEVVTSEMEAYYKSYNNLQLQLARIGINLAIKVMDHPAMHQTIRQDANPIVLYIAWRPNADAYLTRFFHSDSIVVTGAKPDTNFSHYNQIDDLIEAARTEIDPDKQVRLWKHAQIKILEDMAAYPLQRANLPYAHRTGVNYGHEMVASMALYPQITEKTWIEKRK